MITEKEFEKISKVYCQSIKLINKKNVDAVFMFFAYTREGIPQSHFTGIQPIISVIDH